MYTHVHTHDHAHVHAYLYTRVNTYVEIRDDQPFLVVSDKLFNDRHRS